MRLTFPLSAAVPLALFLAACAGTDVPLDSQIALPQAFDQAQVAKGRANIAQWWRQWNDPY